MAKTAQSNDVISGATVLITGAGRGMGELYARRAVAEGARAVSLWDVDEAATNKVAAKLQRLGAVVHVCTADLSQLEEIQRGVAETIAAVGVPDVVINNAGIVRGAPFWEHDPVRDIEGTMRVNILAPMWLTRELLPAMMEDSSREKRILNVASAAGTLANPNMSVYASSKWALIGWSDSVRLELEKHGYSHVSVTTFCPSYISTGMFDGVRGPLFTPIMKPVQAVNAAWAGMLAGKPFVLRPWTVKLSMALRGILPVSAWDVIAGKMFGVYSTMDNFKGRAPKQ